MTIDAKVADLERTCLLCVCCGRPASPTGSTTSFFGGDASISFLAALPRTSSASTAADSFFDLSSSEDLDDDMIVSSVPYAADFVLLPPLEPLPTCRVCSS